MAGFFKKLFGGSDDTAAQTPAPAAPPAAAPSAAGASALTAHMNGTVVELAGVSDQMFASGALGPGAAIEPTAGVVVAPADGEVTVAFPTGHAFGIRTADGLEILIHVGFDTVELDGKNTFVIVESDTEELDGKFFEPRVKKGDSVTRGQVLVEFDLEQVKAAGYPVTTPLVITNAKSSVADLTVANAGSDVAAGADFITAARKG